MSRRPLYTIVKKTSGNRSLIRDLTKLKITQVVSQGSSVIIGRYTANKKALNQILMED